MKKHTIIAAAIMVVVFVSGMAAQVHSRIPAIISDLGRKNLLMALRSANRGLVESAMMQIARVKMRAPGERIQEVKDVIDSLSLKGNEPSVRYRAYLASNVCDNPAWFVRGDPGSEEGVDEFFAAVEKQLQERVLSSRTD